VVATEDSTRGDGRDPNDGGCRIGDGGFGIQRSGADYRLASNRRHVAPPHLKRTKMALAEVHTGMAHYGHWRLDDFTHPIWPFQEMMSGSKDMLRS
jgi:hypothetical protein